MVTIDPPTTVEARLPTLPEPRGEASAWLLDLLVTDPDAGISPAPSVPVDDALGDDALLALHVAHGLADDGWDGVDDRWEAHPTVQSALASWEDVFVRRLVDEVGDLGRPGDVEDLLAWLDDLATPSPDGTSMSGWLAEHGDPGHLREEAVLRSRYQRREADPHSLCIPRLRGEAKAALVRIQVDEYGEGRLRDVHSELFGETMRALDLDPTPGAYLEHLPAEALATNVLVDTFARTRRWRGALMGHLALFEMASVPVMSRMAGTYRHHGFNDWTTLFFDVHVVADAEHQVLASRGLVAPLVAAEPTLDADVRLGAAGLARLEGRLATYAIGRWSEGATALRRPVPPASDPLPGQRDVPVGTDPRRAARDEVPHPA